MHLYTRLSAYPTESFMVISTKLILTLISTIFSLPSALGVTVIVFGNGIGNPGSKPG